VKIVKCLHPVEVALAIARRIAQLVSYMSYMSYMLQCLYPFGSH